MLTFLYLTEGRCVFPYGAQLAVILTINIEDWEKFRPGETVPFLARKH
jgi:hypothetical protein